MGGSSAILPILKKIGPKASSSRISAGSTNGPLLPPLVAATPSRRNFTSSSLRSIPTITKSPAASASTAPSSEPPLPLRIIHPPAHLSSYFYPARLRPHYLTLQSLFLELSLIPTTVSSELLGRIRYGWWRDAIRACYRKEGSRWKNPIILELESAIWDEQVRANGGLVEEHLEAIVDAWEAALSAPASPASLDTLEAHFERLYSRQYYLLLNLVGLSDPAVDEVFSHLGKAHGLLELIIGVPSRLGVKLTLNKDGSQSSPGRLAKNRKPPLSETDQRLVLPAEYLRENNVVQEQVLRQGGAAPGLKDAIFATATRANDYLLTVRRDLAALPSSRMPPLGRPVLTGAATTPYLLQRLEKYDFDPFQPAFRMEAKGRGWRLPLRMWNVNRTGSL